MKHINKQRQSVNNVTDIAILCEGKTRGISGEKKRIQKFLWFQRDEENLTKNNNNTKLQNTFWRTSV